MIRRLRRFVAMINSLTDEPLILHCASCGRRFVPRREENVCPVCAPDVAVVAEFWGGK
jgi:rubrerythrin